MANEDIREVVKARYGSAVKLVVQGARPACCGSDAAPGPEKALAGSDPITRDLYATDETREIPKDALTASFGCGNPTALAEIKPGEVVLDLGSGGGIDVLLSARRVGPTGKAYGLDMTPEMLDLARKNQREAGATNVEFLEGHIEAIPLGDATVDVVISNCVVNLSSDKDKVLSEALRVLRPGGRLAISDVVLRRPLGPESAASMALWTGCIAGALTESDYVAKLERAGFTEVSIEPTRVYTRADAEEMAQGVASGCCGPDPALVEALDGAVMSAFVRARRALG